MTFADTVDSKSMTLSVCAAVSPPPAVSFVTTQMPLNAWAGLRRLFRGKPEPRAARGLVFSCLGVLNRQSRNKHRRSERQRQVRPRGSLSRSSGRTAGTVDAVVRALKARVEIVEDGVRLIKKR
jgi:hypothetical protein